MLLGYGSTRRCRIFEDVMRARAVASFLASVLAVPGAIAAPPPTLAPLVGAWTGSGSIRLENGQTEAVRCKAYYTDKGTTLGVALRCASAGSKIDLRATIGAAGSKVSGTWEERQFNAAGSLDGLVSGNKLSLDMDGGGLKANVVVATTGASQTVSITSAAGTFRAVNIAFARD
jgi:hypothetical protein